MTQLLQGPQLPTEASHSPSDWLKVFHTSCSHSKLVLHPPPPPHHHNKFTEMILLSTHWSRLGTLYLKSAYQHSVHVVTILLHPSPCLALTEAVPGPFSVPRPQCSMQLPLGACLPGLCLSACWCFHVHKANVLSGGSPHRGFPLERRMWFGPNSTHQEGRTKARLSTRPCSLCGCQAAATPPVGLLSFVGLSFQLSGAMLQCFGLTN